MATAHRFLSFSLINSFICILLLATPSWARVNCGETVEPNQFRILLKDLTCPNDNPALRVIGPATLDLRGHTVDCAELTTHVGIAVEGEKATIKNGTVTGCSTGVTIGGTGRHRIVGITTIKNRDDGFENLEDSDSNTYLSNIAQDNNDPADPGGAHDGFEIRPSNNHRLYLNISQNNGEGFDVGGSRHLLSGNIAKGNLTGEGFFLGGENHKATHNIASHNGQDGFHVNGGGNTLRRNMAIGNEESGILVDGGAENNILKKNVAQGNGKQNGGFDLEDKNPNCDNNQWRWNVFGTANPVTCIR